jgi:hypothetical protein
MALDGGKLTPKEGAPDTHWIGGWVGPRASLDTVAKKKFPVPARSRTQDINTVSIDTELCNVQNTTYNLLKRQIKSIASQTFKIVVCLFLLYIFLYV